MFDIIIKIMESLNNKINATQEDTLFQAQAIGIYGYNTTDKKMKAGHMSDANELKVAVSQHLVDGPDMKARSDIADPATSTFLKCDTDGKLMIEATLELDSSGLAKESKQDTQITALDAIVIGVSYNDDIANRTLLTAQNQTNGDQISKCMGSKSGYTGGTQRQIRTSDDGRLEVDINSGGSTSDATAANQVVSQTKLDSIISNTASLGDTANRTLLTAQNQTNGNQLSMAMGSEDATTLGTQHQIKTSNAGRIEVDINSGAGSSDATAANQILQLTQETATAVNTLAIVGLQTNIKAGIGDVAGFTNSIDSKTIACDTGAVVVSSSALPLGSSTSVNQVVSQGKLDSVISNTASLGDTANRTLLIAQNQTNGNQITKCMGNFSGTQVQLKVDSDGVLDALRAASTNSQTVVVPSSGTFTSTTIDMNGYSKLSVMGSSSNSSDNINIVTSVDDITYYAGQESVFPNFASGTFSRVIDVGGSRYIQITQTDTMLAQFTMNLTTSKR
jgi:hypothetical protein